MARWCARCGAQVTVADTRAAPPQLQALRNDMCPLPASSVALSMLAWWKERRACRLQEPRPCHLHEVATGFQELARAMNGYALQAN
jgi:hypothetical protein